MKLGHPAEEHQDAIAMGGMGLEQAMQVHGAGLVVIRLEHERQSTGQFGGQTAEERAGTVRQVRMRIKGYAPALRMSRATRAR